MLECRGGTDVICKTGFLSSKDSQNKQKSNYFTKAVMGTRGVLEKLQEDGTQRR